MTDAGTMEATLRALAPLPRDLVSDGFDQALELLGRDFPLQIHEYPTGSQCLTWIVPEKWTCREARLETLEGKTVFSSIDHPLHVVSYSLPFDGVVERDELFKHLHTHPRLPEAVPFIHKYYQRDWGLCCSGELKETLKDSAYRVVIDSEFESGTLKVAEMVVPGRRDDCLVFCAHLCHPAQVNDDLSGVLVGLEAMRRLLADPRPEYTYRMLVLPESVGSAAWLSSNEALLSHMRGGFFLEMLARDHPYNLLHSNEPESEIDILSELVVGEHDPQCRVADFMQGVLNDERMFNGPGIRVPMLSLSRALPPEHTHKPFREYHSNQDDLEHADLEAMADALDLVLALVDAWENNCVPIPTFKGELFCSRYPAIDYEPMQHLVHSVPYQADGWRTTARIAQCAGLNISEVRSFVDLLCAEGLMTRTTVPPETGAD